MRPDAFTSWARFVNQEHHRIWFVMIFWYNCIMMHFISIFDDITFWCDCVILHFRKPFPTIWKLYTKRICIYLIIQRMFHVHIFHGLYTYFIKSCRAGIFFIMFYCTFVLVDVPWNKWIESQSVFEVILTCYGPVTPALDLVPIPLTIFWSNLCAVLWFKMCWTDNNEILHTSRQCYCRDVCKILLWSVEYIMNNIIAKKFDKFRIRSK